MKKTVISEMSKLIQNGFESVVTYRQNDLILETETHVYELMILEEKFKLKAELEKAKKLKHGN